MELLHSIRVIAEGGANNCSPVMLVLVLLLVVVVVLLLLVVVLLVAVMLLVMVLAAVEQVPHCKCEVHLESFREINITIAIFKVCIIGTPTDTVVDAAGCQVAEI